MALTATKEQLLFGKGGLSQPIVARRGSPGDFANSVRRFLRHGLAGAMAASCFENSAPTLPLCDRLLRLRRLLLGLNGDDIAQTLQPALEVGGGAGLIELIKIRLAELAIADAAAEHVIGCDQDLVR